MNEGDTTKDGHKVIKLMLNGKAKLVVKDDKGNFIDAPDETTDDPETYCHANYAAGNTEFKETSRKLIKMGRGNVLGIHTYDNIKNGNANNKIKCVSVVNWKSVPDKATWMPSSRWGGYGKIAMPVSRLKEILPDLLEIVK